MKVGRFYPKRPAQPTACSYPGTYTYFARSITQGLLFLRRTRLAWLPMISRGRWGAGGKIEAIPALLIYSCRSTLSLPPHTAANHPHYLVIHSPIWRVRIIDLGKLVLPRSDYLLRTYISRPQPWDSGFAHSRWKTRGPTEPYACKPVWFRTDLTHSPLGHTNSLYGEDFSPGTSLQLTGREGGYGWSCPLGQRVYRLEFAG